MVLINWTFTLLLNCKITPTIMVTRVSDVKTEIFISKSTQIPMSSLLYVF